VTGKNHPPHSPQEENTRGTYDLLAFRLNQQNFALSLDPIQQIVPMVSITPIPQVDPSILGVVNLRGKPVPVIDLALAFGCPPTRLRLYTPIIFVDSGGRTFGLVVDEVTGVVNLAADQVVRLADIMPQGVGRSPLLQGVAQLPEGMFPLVDLEQVFLNEKLLTLNTPVVERAIDPIHYPEAL
jgi:purine-binding chemotaxis protein CheW